MYHDNVYCDYHAIHTYLLISKNFMRLFFISHTVKAIMIKITAITKVTITAITTNKPVEISKSQNT